MSANAPNSNRKMNTISLRLCNEISLESYPQHTPCAFSSVCIRDDVLKRATGNRLQKPFDGGF
jgi:hypothetical protein